VTNPVFMHIFCVFSPSSISQYIFVDFCPKLPGETYRDPVQPDTEEAKKETEKEKCP